MSSASVGDFAIFKLHTGTALALYPRSLLAKDANVKDSEGFGGITLAQNVATREEVDSVLSQAVKAGGRLLKKAVDAEWGGYSGYFADPNGHAWEVAWNPHFQSLRHGIPRLLSREVAFCFSPDKSPQAGQAGCRRGLHLERGALLLPE